MSFTKNELLEIALLIIRAKNETKQIMRTLKELTNVLGGRKMGHVPNSKMFIEFILIRHVENLMLDLESLERGHNAVTENNSDGSKSSMA